MAPAFDDEFRLILNHTVKITRRTGFTTTGMGDRRWTGETTVHAALSVMFEGLDGGEKSRRAYGDMRPGDYRMFATYDSNLQEGDLVRPVTFVTGLTMGELVELVVLPDFDGNSHHVEAIVRKLP